MRKSRNANGDDSDKKKNQKSPVQGVWELRGHCNESKKLKNSREFTETVFSSEVCSVTHHQGDQHTVASENDQKVMSPVSKMAMPGEVVVFDDIGDTWHDEKRLEEDCTKETPSYNHTAPSNMYNSVDNEPERVTKVIGNLPIAVYEGSPRRYGPRQIDSNCSHPQLPSAQSLLASPSVYPPRPGFPQRVICSPSEIETTQSAENTTYNVSSSALVGASILSLILIKFFREVAQILLTQPRPLRLRRRSTIYTNFPKRGKSSKSFSNAPRRKRRTSSKRNSKI